MSVLEKLHEELRKQALLGGAVHIITWDQEVCMPKAAAVHRAAVVGNLMGLMHQRAQKTLIPLLREAMEAPDLSEEQRHSVAVLLEDADIVEKVPEQLVQALSETASLAQAVWVEARQKSDFSAFAPYLEKLVALSREKAQAIGYKEEPMKRCFGCMSVVFLLRR